MSDRRDRVGRVLQEHCKNKKQGDLLHILEELEKAFPNHALVAVHKPRDVIVHGEEYVCEQERLLMIAEANKATLIECPENTEH